MKVRPGCSALMRMSARFGHPSHVYRSRNARLRHHGPRRGRSADVLFQKLERAGPGEGRARRVVALAVIAVKTVVGVIDVDLDFGMGGGDFLDAWNRDVRVLVAEMEDLR